MKNGILAIVILTLLSGCSDLKEPVSTNKEPSLEVHPSGWSLTWAPNFHGKFIQNSGWDLKQCQQCHGRDYAGGIAQSSCLSCHPATPEDCVVCHGGVENATGAPPKDIAGNVTPLARGVGAHTRHLEGGTLSSGFPCSTCHVVPDSLYAPGHVDSDLPAEVQFSGLAVAEEAHPVWNGESCQNTYCHGFFEGGNQNNAPVWTRVDGSQDACGTCHGLPPDGDHPQIENCVLCHAAVVDSTNVIIDKTRHVNGTIDFGT